VTAGPAPVVGRSLVGIGLVHLATTGVFYPESVRSFVQGRVLGAVEADPELAAVRESGSGTPQQAWGSSPWGGPWARSSAPADYGGTPRQRWTGSAPGECR
jgi:hypothetical protein